MKETYRTEAMIILLGCVSLFADMTYESARALVGPFLAQLGASSALVGFVGGLGELIGYFMRFISGYSLQRIGGIWFFLFGGYVLNLLAVPAFALARGLFAAVILYLLERIGKGLRTPARDTLLAYAGDRVGPGLAFGIHDALDSVGAMLGPFLVGMMLFITASYRQAFLWLAIPATLSLILLALVFALFHHRERKESLISSPFSLRAYPRQFYHFVLGASLMGMGTLDYPLIAYHFHQVRIYPEYGIPLLYGGVMGGIALLSPLLGKSFDQGRTLLLKGVFLLCGFSPYFLLAQEITLTSIGLILYSFSLAVEGAIFVALVSCIVSSKGRPQAYGLFHSIYGVSWFLGSALLGYLYHESILLTRISATLMTLGGVVIVLTLAVWKNNTSSLSNAGRQS